MLECAAACAALPDVPTIVEAGYPEVQGINFNGMFAPKATPQPVIERLSDTVSHGAAQEDGDRAAGFGSAPRRGQRRRTKFGGFWSARRAKWSDVMKRANIKPVAE